MPHRQVKAAQSRLFNEVLSSRACWEPVAGDLVREGDDVKVLSPEMLPMAHERSLEAGDPHLELKSCFTGRLAPTRQ